MESPSAQNRENTSDPEFVLDLAAKVERRLSEVTQGGASPLD